MMFMSRHGGGRRLRHPFLDDIVYPENPNRTIGFDVDAIRKTHQATATVFVKSGDEFVRVSTNVLTPEGKRGIGTQLARNAAYEAVIEQFAHEYLRERRSARRWRLAQPRKPLMS